MKSRARPCRNCQGSKPVKPTPVIIPPPPCDAPECEENYLGKCIIIEDEFKCGTDVLAPAGSKLTPILNTLFGKFCEYRDKSVTLVQSSSCIKLEGDGSASNPIKASPLINPSPDNLLECTDKGLKVTFPDLKDLVKEILDVIKESPELQEDLKEIIEPWFPEIPDFPDPEPEPKPCGKPSGLYTGSVTHTGGKINWAPVSGVKGYNVRYRKTNDLAWTSLEVVSNSATLSGLNPSSSYEVQVQTVCLNNLVSDWTSIPLVTEEPPAILCASPGGLTVSNLTETSAKLNWNPVLGALSYNVRYRKVGDTEWISQRLTTTSITLAGLVAGTRYQWAVQTVCLLNSLSGWVDSDFTTKTPPATCDPVTNIKTTEITQTSAVVTWNGPTAATFKFAYRVKGTTSWIERIVTSPTITVTGLTAKKTYEVQITSLCANGAIGTPVDFSFTTLDVPVIPLCTPVKLNSIQVTEDTVELCPPVINLRAVVSNEVEPVACGLITGLTVTEYTGDASSLPLSFTVVDTDPTNPNKKRISISNPSTSGELIYNWSVYKGRYEDGGDLITADFQIKSTGSFEIDTSKSTKQLQAGQSYYLYVAEQPGNKRQSYISFTQAAGSTNPNPEIPPVSSKGKLVASAFPTSH